MLPGEPPYLRSLSRLAPLTLTPPPSRHPAPWSSSPSRLWSELLAGGHDDGAAHLCVLLSRALTPNLPLLSVRALTQISGLGVSQFGAAFLGGASFQGTPRLRSSAGQGPAAAAAMRGAGGGNGHSGKSEQADASAYGLRPGLVFYWCSYLCRS